MGLPRSNTYLLEDFSKNTYVGKFLVSPGKRSQPELLKEATTGCDGLMSDTGYSNAEILNICQKYVQTGNSQQPTLHLYDGHRSNTSLSLNLWGCEKNTIIFLSPPNTTHLLQPMAVGCSIP